MRDTIAPLRVLLAVAAVLVLWAGAARARSASGPAGRVGYLTIAVLQAIALARFPHRLGWSSPSGVVYVIVLVSMAVAVWPATRERQVSEGRSRKVH